MTNFFLLLLYQSYLSLLNLPFLADEYEMLKGNLSAPAKIDNVFYSVVWPLSFFLPSIILFFFIRIMSSPTNTEYQDDTNQISIYATKALIVPSTAIIHNDVLDGQPFVASNTFTQTLNLIFLIYIPRFINNQLKKLITSTSR